MKLYFDGASSGNPGPAGIGVVLYDDAGNLVKEISEPIGVATNNVAEYKALIRGLEEARARGCEVIEAYSDSELLVRQLKGQYRVRNEHLQSLYRRAQALLDLFKAVQVQHIPRTRNQRADELAKAAVHRSSQNS